MLALEESILDLFETLLVNKFPSLYISAEESKTLNKFLIQSNKKSNPLQIDQFVDGEKVVIFGDFFGLQVHKTSNQRYHVDLYVKKTSRESGEGEGEGKARVSIDIFRIPSFSQEKATLTEVVSLLETMFVSKEYFRNVQMKIRMLK
jgi:hypothetical protein